MYRQTFAWGRSKKRFRRPDDWVEWLWIGGLLLAAVLIFGINLGGLPLRDWDEGTVAQVARDIWRAPSGSMRWLYPTLAGEPYLNKPPLMHWLIALAYFVGGVNEWTTRLPGAMLTALSVPLLYCIGREIFPRRLCAIFSALIYLTMLPVVRHGRLAMLDGAVECFFLLMIWCLLRSRRDLRYCLGVGLSFGLICLTKSIMGVLLGAVALAFLSWDTPRLLSSWYLWIGVLLGSADVAFWYGAQWLHYGHSFTDEAIVNQSLERIWSPVEAHGGPIWYYLLEICKYAWPWLLFLPQGLHLTWENRNLSWAKLVLVWSGVYLLAISVMQTKLPWYVLPLYPAIALAVGFSHLSPQLGSSFGPAGSWGDSWQLLLQPLESEAGLGVTDDFDGSSRDNGVCGCVSGVRRQAIYLNLVLGFVCFTAATHDFSPLGLGVRRSISG